VWLWQGQVLGLELGVALVGGKTGKPCMHPSLW